jgi:hypothetical protein
MPLFFKTSFDGVCRTYGFDSCVGGLNQRQTDCRVDVFARMKAGETFEVTRAGLLDDDYFIFACGLVIRLLIDGRVATLVDLIPEDVS